ncbi:MAG TPA: GGDEF domain-containing protein [Candidatus Acidoferrales bacterium]|nr:GGDEF domain-containing protein [Candidatus Acidoferrales bacterium]
MNADEQTPTLAAGDGVADPEPLVRVDAAEDPPPSAPAVTRQQREAMRGIPLAATTWALLYVFLSLARAYDVLSLSQTAQDVLISLAVAWTSLQFLYFRTQLCQWMPWRIAVADVGFVAGHGLLALAMVFLDGFSLFGVMLLTLIVPITTAFLGLGVGFGATMTIGAIVQGIVLLGYMLSPADGRVDGLLFAMFWAAWSISWFIGAVTNGNAQAKKRLIATMLRTQREAHALIERQTRALDEKSRELEAANARLHQLSMVDGLTAVSNRRRFDEALHEEWRRARRAQSGLRMAPLAVADAAASYESMALLLLDIDHFKQYNDRYGHLAGDACLKQVAATIAGAIRRSGDMVARYGGEEFAIILPATPLAGAFGVAERIRSMIWDLGLPHEGSPFGRVTVSIGVADSQGQACQAESELLRLADGALYAAKRAGRNRVAQALFEVGEPIVR